MPAKRYRLICTYSKREWNQIEAGAKESGKSEVINYLISEIKKLESSYLNYHPVEESLLPPKARGFYLPPESQKIIIRLSDKLKIKPSTLVSRLILNPLLKK